MIILTIFLVILALIIGILVGGIFMKRRMRSLIFDYLWSTGRTERTCNKMADLICSGKYDEEAHKAFNNKTLYQ